MLLGYVHTKPDKFENGGFFIFLFIFFFSRKLIKKFSAQTKTLKCYWEGTATEIIWLLWRQRLQNVSFSPSIRTHKNFIHFGERFQKGSVFVDQKCRLRVNGSPIRRKRYVFKLYRLSVDVPLNLSQL